METGLHCWVDAKEVSLSYYNDETKLVQTYIIYVYIYIYIYIPIMVTRAALRMSCFWFKLKLIQESVLQVLESLQASSLTP